MPVLNSAAELATELERVKGKVPELFALEDGFFNLVNERTKRDKVSTRPERVPFRVAAGAKGRVVNLDGGDMGRGGGPQYAYGSLAPVQFDWIIEWTKQAQIATDSSEKAVVNAAKDIVKYHLECANHDLNALMEYGDGVNTIGICTPNPNITGSPFYDAGNLIIYVDNAARFRQGADYDVYNGGPGTGLTATVTIKGIDYVNKALYLTAAPGTAPTSGAYLIFNNSTGVAGSGINGIVALQSYSTTGTYMNVAKATYPGNFVTPSVNAGGATLTPAVARLLLNSMRIAAGADTTNTGQYVFHTGLDQRAAWENTGINVTNIMQTADSATGRDQLAKMQVSTIGGIRIMDTRTAIPGRIDLLNLSTWWVAEVQELDFYSAGGNEVFPVYGGSGGIAASLLKYLIWMGNVGCENPKANAVLYNLAVPTGY